MIIKKIFIGEKFNPFRQRSRVASLKFESYEKSSMVFIIILNSVWLTYQSAPNLIFTHDFSSYQLLAETVGPGEGAPYLTYFDIKPPFLIYSVAFWIFVFGKSVVSIFTFNVLIISGLFFASGRLIAMASTPRYSNLALLFAMLIIDSTNYLSSMFFNSESLGLLLALTGLIVLLSPRGVNWGRTLFSGLLFGAAFQTKEVYVFTALIGVIICLTFPIKESTRFRLCSTYIISGFTSQLLIGLALFLDGAFASYREVLSFKSTIFPFPSFDDLLTRLRYLETELQIYYLNLSLLVLLVLLISIYRHRIFNWQNSLISSKLLRLNGIYLIFFIFISIGFAWQGKPMFGHYGITVIFPVLIFIFSVGFSTIRVLASCVTSRSRKLLLSILAFAIVIAPSMSNFNVVSVNLEKANDTKQNLRSLYLKNDNSNFYTIIESTSTSDECIQVAYGWGAATIYNYSDRKPCTRYFLANLILGSAARLEMRTELIANPPKLIIYSVDGADLDVQSFEQNVFPYQSLIDSCYKRTSNNNIWVARSGKFETRSCIKGLLNLH